MYILYLFVSIFFIVLSFFMYRKWFNPLSIFFYVWNFCIALYELNAISFFELTRKTWMVLYVGSLFYALGIIFGFLLGEILGTETKMISEDDSLRIKKEVRRFILIFSFIACISIIPNLMTVIHAYGFNLIGNSNQIYQMSIRESDATSTSISAENFIFVAMTLSGIYLARYGMTGAIWFTVILAILAQLSNGSRGALFIEILLLVAPSILLKEKTGQWKKRKRSLMILGIGLAIFIVVITFLRKSSLVDLPYANSMIYKFKGLSGFVYNVIFYFTSPLATMNVFLQNPIHSFWGAATFRPFYLLLSHLGVSNYNIDFINEYLFYSPLPANVISFFGELVYDFGYFGMVVATFIFSFLFGFSFQKCKKNTLSAWNIVLSVCFSLVMLSFFAWFLRPAYLWVSLIVGTLSMMYVNRKVR